MKLDLYDGLYATAYDVIEPILEELNNSKHINIVPNNETKYGFTRDGKINKEGIYLIYKNMELVYVGLSRSSISYRIGRFFAGARGTDRKDEAHPGGLKYARAYKNFDDITMKSVDFDFSSLPPGVKLEDVELELIRTLRPRFNIEIYKSSFVSDVVLKLKV